MKRDSKMTNCTKSYKGPEVQERERDIGKGKMKTKSELIDASNKINFKVKLLT